MPKDTLKIAITGHIDHGKSTLIGQLLLATGSLPKDKLKDIKKISKEFGKDTQLAYLADQLKEEREKNITIETTEVFLKTAKRNYVIIDTPGHLEFIKNMLTGASHADCAIIIIDANEGVQEQTRRHSYLLKLLTLNHVTVLINKMDLIKYDENKYTEIKEEITNVLNTLDIDISHIIPISAKQGDNVARKSSLMRWYKGLPLLRAMDTLRMTPKGQSQSMRFPIQDLYNIEGDQVAVGKVISGIIRTKDSVIHFPSQEQVTIESIKVFGQEKSEAKAQENIGVTLTNSITIKRGDILCTAQDNIAATKSFKGNIFWMSKTPLKRNESITVRCATQHCDCFVEEINNRIDPTNLDILEENASELGINEAGIVTFKLTHPAFLENFHDIPELGRYTVERSESLQGAGTVIEKY